MRDGRVLWVDDSAEMRRFYQMVWERAGVRLRTVVAEDGETGFRLLRDGRRRWSALLTDHVHGGPSGGELLRWARQHRPRLPVAMITASPLWDVLRQSGGRRPDVYCALPGRVEDYLRVGRFLQRPRRRRRTLTLWSWGRPPGHLLRKRMRRLPWALGVILLAACPRADTGAGAQISFLPHTLYTAGPAAIDLTGDGRPEGVAVLGGAVSTHGDDWQKRPDVYDMELNAMRGVGDLLPEKRGIVIWETRGGSRRVLYRTSRHVGDHLVRAAVLEFPAPAAKQFLTWSRVDGSGRFLQAALLRWDGRRVREVFSWTDLQHGSLWVGNLDGNGTLAIVVSSQVTAGEPVASPAEYEVTVWLANLRGEWREAAGYAVQVSPREWAALGLLSEFKTVARFIRSWQSGTLAPGWRVVRGAHGRLKAGGPG